MLLWLLRALFLGLVLIVAVFAYTFCAVDLEGMVGGWGGVLAGLSVVCIAGLVLYTDISEENKQIATISAIYFGSLFGLLIGWLFGIGIEVVLETFSGALQLDGEKLKKLTVIVRVLVSLITCYVSISILIQTRNDFRFIIPYVEFSKQVKGGRPLVLDASVIIDGRIADLCETRIIDTKLVITKFVLNEMQSIADSTDKLKRNRGRRGLDIVKKLQANPRIDVTIHDGVINDGPPGIEKAKLEDRLVFFAKSISARLVTNDFNLSKLAQVQGVEVINLNDVSNSLKMIAIPGEYMIVKVVKAGDQPGQGVGYLDDGTMVVIEQGKNNLGQDVSIVVTSVLQTPAGRMIFGRIEMRPSGSYPPVQAPMSTAVPPAKT